MLTEAPRGMINDAGDMACQRVMKALRHVVRELSLRKCSFIGVVSIISNTR
jgi:hypothetical protein